jgi:prevent-host-death family protein
MPPTEWTIVDAESRLHEILKMAAQEPQTITHRGRQFVILNGEDYRRLKGSPLNLKDLILRGPGLAGIDLAHDRSGDREAPY